MQAHMEIEVKLRVADLAALKKLLRARHARWGKRVHECNVLFDTPQGRFRRRDELVRLRTNDGAGILTFKGRARPRPKGRKGRCKIRHETEFAVSNPRAAASFLSGLGLVESFRYEKYRTELRVSAVLKAHVYLDETPIGAFVEIEGAPAAIDRAARLLGYQPADYITESYLALYARHCRVHGRAMGDLVFALRKKSRNTSV